MDSNLIVAILELWIACHFEIFKYQYVLSYVQSIGEYAFFGLKSVVDLKALICEWSVPLKKLTCPFKSRMHKFIVYYWNYYVHMYISRGRQNKYLPTLDIEFNLLRVEYEEEQQKALAIASKKHSQLLMSGISKSQTSATALCVVHWFLFNH